MHTQNQATLTFEYDLEIQYGCRGTIYMQESTGVRYYTLRSGTRNNEIFYELSSMCLNSKTFICYLELD